VRERFRVNGKAVPEEIFNQLGEELARAAEGTEFTYFEYATVLAALIFCRTGVDVVIWETGLGGRLDATNAVQSCGCVITNIAYDHQNLLGNTLAEIAAEKAGILKEGVPLFYNRLPDEAREVIETRARELNCPVFPPEAPVPDCKGYALSENGMMCQRFTYQGSDFTLPLPGAMQRENFRTVYNVVRYFGAQWHFDADAALQSLQETRWPGRCQLVRNTLMIDGGHNPDGVTAFTEALKELYPGVKHPVVYGAFKDKDYKSCVQLLSGIASQFIFVPVPAAERPVATGEELGALADQFNIPWEYETDIAKALADAKAAKSPSGVAVVSGSLYLTGDVLQREVPLSEVIDL
jgi:dihydrofolate synthase/folylpolyglutamate synthase